MSASQLYALNARGAGPRSYKISGLRRYDPRDVQAWLDENATSDPRAEHSARLAHRGRGRSA